MNDFAVSEVDRLLAGGWNACAPIAALVRDRGLPAITCEYLLSSISAAEWKRAEEATGALTDHFSTARFADEVQYGVLLVPTVDALDTRRPMPLDVRAAQVGASAGDVFDERLPAGRALPPGRPWQLVVSVVGNYGPSLGSYRDVVDSGDFVVLGQDTRQWMTRQVWGARVLQWAVRFRLGKPDRGIGSARVAPALLIDVQ